MEKIKKFSCDVLIIGAGASGLRTAIEAHDLGKNVLLIGKSRHGDAHTVLATGGINAALGTMDPEDNWMIHAVDTLREGQFLADPKFVELLCKNAPDAVNELVKWGARFEAHDGKLVQRFFGAHTYRRTCFYGDQTGNEIMRVLLEQIEKREIKVLDEIFILKLIGEKKVKGAIGIDLNKEVIVIINAKSVVLATGGYSRIYSVSSSRPYENFGDGVSIAFDSGCELMDMEMIQFHPTGMVWPEEMIGTLVTEAVRGEGGVLLNKSNERFMKRYDPERMELSARDIVSRAIDNEIYEGRGTQHEGVWLDISMKPAEYIKKRLPQMYSQFKATGVDITKEKMEVAPTAHYTMGGVKTNYKGETRLRGLFAVGEVSCDVHGANRLGGNSLAETIVFGKMVGREAAKFCKVHKKELITEKETVKLINEIDGIFQKGKGKLSPDYVKKEAQELMWKYVRIFREKKKLDEALRKIKELKKKLGTDLNIRTIQDFLDAMNARSVILLSEVVTRSALLRKESRGAHFRKDYPKQSKVAKHIILRKERGKLKFYFKKVPKVTGILEKTLKMKLKTDHHLLE